MENLATDILSKRFGIEKEIIEFVNDSEKLILDKKERDWENKAV